MSGLRALLAFFVSATTTHHDTSFDNIDKPLVVIGGHRKRVLLQ